MTDIRAPNEATKRGIVSLFSATVISQLVPLAVMPLLTRLYDPSDFGVYATMIAIIAVATIFSSGKYELAMIVARTTNMKRTLFNLCQMLLLVYFICTACFCIFYAIFVEFHAYLLFIPAGILLVGCHNILICFSNSLGNFTKIAKNTFSHSLFNNTLALVLSFSTNLGLILGFLLSRGITNYFLITQSEWKKSVDSWSSFVQRRRRYLVALTHFKKFPLFAAPADALDVLLRQLPILLLTAFATSLNVGLYSLTERVLALPLALIGRAIALPFRKEAAEQFEKHNNCRPTLTYFFCILVSLSCIPFLLLYLFASQMFVLLFGEEWAEAGEYARILTPLFFFQFIVSPLTFVFHIAGKQHVDLILHLFMIVSAVSCFAYGIFVVEDFYIALKMYVFCFSFAYLVYLALCFWFAKK